MYVLGHHYVSADIKTILFSDRLEDLLENIAHLGDQQRQPSITTEGYEVELTRLLITLQGPRHVDRVSPILWSVCDAMHQTTPPFPNEGKDGAPSSSCQ